MLLKNEKIHKAERNWEMIVARAAPCTPNLKKNKDRIEDDVYDGAQDYGDHPDFAEALGIDEMVHPQTDHDKNGPQQIDG